MLIKFSVENYLSIKKEIILSMLASKDNEHEETLIEDRGKRYLKSSVIYGANASGKSNVLNAFWFMVNYVLTSHEKQLHKSIERIPFKFDKLTPSQPTRFEVIFIAQGIRYTYGFAVTDKEVVEEGTVNSFAQIFSCSIDIAAQVSLSASARHRNGNNSAGTTFAY